MKVGFVADKIPYAQPRGWGVYARELLKSLLAREDDIIYECFYNIFRKGNRQHVVEGNPAKVHNRIWPLPGRFVDMAWDRPGFLSAEALLGPVDVVHIPHELLPPVRAARTVVTVHDVTFLRHPEHLDDDFVALFSRRIRKIARQADRIIADSHNTKRDLLELTDAVDERVIVAHCGVDARFQPATDSQEVARCLQRYGVSAPYVLFVGAADEDKNLDRLGEAFSRVRRQIPELLLVLAGRDDWGYSRLMSRLSAAGHDRGVVRTGFVADTDLPLLYSGAEVLAIPSIHEGFGLPALEAMACGTAVVAADAASLPEVVGDAGILVDPYSVDSICEGLEKPLFDADVRSRCETLGRRQAATFSWEATAQKVTAVYEDLLQ